MWYGNEGREVTPFLDRLHAGKGGPPTEDSFRVSLAAPAANRAVEGTRTLRLRVD